jgi:hypothetical protein
LRRAAVGRALFVTLTMCAAAVAAPAQGHGSRVSPAPAAGLAEGEDDRYLARANQLRTRILEQATWAALGDSPCREGALRIYSSDSATAANSDVTKLIAELEAIVVARGIEQPLDTAPVHELLGMLIGWESGISRPRWDVLAGQDAREAIAAGLTGEFLNPVTQKCELLAPFDTMRVVLPEGVTVAPPPSRAPTILVASGPSGLNRLRDEFFATIRPDLPETMTYSSIIAVVEWRGYAVVAVNRPAELRGAVLQKKTAGGAAYLFHRVDGEWRLLTITRTWS